jgi:hypothetical protein
LNESFVENVSCNDGENSPEKPCEKIKVNSAQQQEVMGRLPIFRSGVPCIVVGEAWPAWLPVVSALGARVTAVVCGESAGWAVEGSEVPQLDVEAEGSAKFVRESSTEVLVFVSGSARFMSKWKANLSDKKQLVLALDGGWRVSAGLQKDFPDIVWQRICHDEVGGVTACRNWIGASTGIELKRFKRASINVRLAKY